MQEFGFQPSELAELENRTGYRVAEMLRDLSLLSEHDLEILRDRLQEVAQEANTYDVIVLTGKSRAVLSTLLTAFEVDAAKIIEIDGETNNALFKDKNANLEERVQLLQETLSSAGIKLAEGNSVCVVDDFAHSGLKGLTYLLLLSKLFVPAETAFFTVAAASSLDPSRWLATDNPVTKLASPREIEPLLERFFYPESPDATSMNILRDLATLASISHPENSYYNLPASQAALLRQFVEAVLTRITSF